MLAIRLIIFMIDATPLYYGFRHTYGHDAAYDAATPSCHTCLPLMPLLIFSRAALLLRHYATYAILRHDAHDALR